MIGFILPASRGRRFGIKLLSIAVFVYALIRGQLLIGILVAGWIWLLPIAWRFLIAVETIADALQRIADQQETD